MSKREPAPVAILSARIMRAYPSLSPYSAASLATELESIERAQRRHAEAQCNGDYSHTVVRDLGKPGGVPSFMSVDVHNPDAEQRAGERIANRCVRWENRVVALHDRGPINLLAGDRDKLPAIELQGDPRGAVLLLRLPGEAEASSV